MPRPVTKQFAPITSPSHSRCVILTFTDILRDDLARGDVLDASGAGMVTIWFNPDRVEAGDRPERCRLRVESWLEFVALYRGAHR